MYECDVYFTKMQRYSIIRLEGKCQMDDVIDKVETIHKLCYTDMMIQRINSVVSL